MEANKRKTTSREEKLTLGSAKGESDREKIADLGKHHKTTRLRQAYVITLS
jgi:hypothetical protein